MPAPTARDRFFARYAATLDRRSGWVLGLAALLAAAAAAVTATLPLKTDLTDLLPPSEPSVRDLKHLQARTRSLGTLLVAVESRDAARRSVAARAMAARIRALGPEMVGTLVVDDGAARRFGWDHRFLYAPLADLEAARDGLRERTRQAKLDANPLYVDLDDEEDEAAAEADRAATDEKSRRLRERLHEAEDKVAHPEELISSERDLQLIIVKAPFSSSDMPRSERLLERVRDAARATEREAGQGVAVGLADEIVTGVAEQHAILRGMVLAILATIAVVGLSLVLYLRSVRAAACLLGSLAVGVLCTFAVTRLTIGYLNSASAFLSAIVVGNGINFGIIVLARHLEQRRAGDGHVVALATALGGSLVGTITAALGSGIAYASLLVTDFRGFHDFGAIGAVGMVLCWVSAYTVLPAGIAALDRRGMLPPGRPPSLGPLVARLLPRNLRAVAVIAALVTAATGVCTWRYLSGDPYEYNWEHLRADSAEANLGRRWMHRIDVAFGYGLASGFAVGVDRPEDAAVVEAILRAHAEPDAPDAKAGQPRPRGSAEGLPSPTGPLFRKVSTIQDALPDRQEEKLAVLADLRVLTGPDTLDELSAEDRADVERLRPPADLAAIRAHDIPEALVPQFVEKDGSRGKLVYADQASRFNGWNGRHMEVFAAAVRRLHFPDGTHLGGGAFVFADILRAVERDGPRATLAALLAVLVLVVVVVGPNRYGLATLAASLAGTSAMLACAWLLGVKVNFLDFAALPITLGISVDYAVNVVARQRGDAADSARRALATTGGAVVLCSWTTIVGYGSLLLSANAGIRSFGMVAVVGELTCLAAALTVAPAVLDVLTPRARAAVG